jgi:molecular chaperone GrpE
MASKSNKEDIDKKSKDVKNEEINIESNTQSSQEESNNEEPQVEKDPIEKLEEELTEQKNKYLLLYSDFENYRKRTQKEKLDLISSAGTDMLKTIIPLLDDFERAIVANSKLDDTKALRDNFSMMYEKLQSTLSTKGLKKMNAKGTKFDSELHEAITKITAPSKKEKGKVIDAIEDGYYLNDKIIRYAKVVVGE